MIFKFVKTMTVEADNLEEAVLLFKHKHPDENLCTIEVKVEQ